MGRDRALLQGVRRGLCEFLQAQSLLITTKSQTEPLALVTWIGKTFDLARGTVRNAPGTVRKALAVVVSQLDAKKSGEGNRSATVAVWAPAGHDGVHVWLVQVEICRVQVRSQSLTHDDPQHG